MMPEVSQDAPGRILKSPHVLAVDLGSGSVKAGLVSLDGNIAAVAAEPVTTYLQERGGAEQDPREWWDAVKKTIRNVISASALPSGNIIAVACDSQWSVVVPVDDRANPLMPAIHWLDTRGGTYNRMMIRGFPSIEGYGAAKLMKWVRATGLAPTRTGVDSLGHVLFIKHERPDIFAKTFKFLEPMDFLTARFTGNIIATQKTMAPFVLVNNRRWGERRYSRTLLKMAGLEANKFPDLLENDGMAGTLRTDVAKDLGLPAGIPVVCGVSDSNASVIGSGSAADFDPIIYIGTSLYMTCHVPFLKTDLFHMLTALPSPFPDTWMVFGEQGAGGKCVEFFLNDMVYARDEFQSGDLPADAYRRFNESGASATPGSGGVLFLPWLNGSVVPSEDPYVRGGFLNISLRTRRSHLARAVMEGIAFNNRWTLEAFARFIGRPVNGFRFSGGGALSDLWAQIHADVLGVPIHQVEDPAHATVRGTGLLAFVALKMLSRQDIPRLVQVRRVFEPDGSHGKIYDLNYRAFREAFARNRKIFKALNA